MKKVIVCVAIALSAIVSNAEYLNWQVGSSITIGGTTYSTPDYSDVRLYATANDTTKDYGIFNVPGTYSTQLDSGASGYSYYLELLSYDTSADSYSKVAQTASFTYQQLQGAISTGSLDASAMTAIWTGAAVVATPEPTSGLLLLMGFAMLGLKRKKEV